MRPSEQMVSSSPVPTPAKTPPVRRGPAVMLPRFAIVMAALLALAAFPQSALFAVDRIEVDGMSALPPDDVAALAGLRRGERLFAVDADGVLRRLRADPRIKDAAVQIRPPGTVRVRIVERRPVIALLVGRAFALLGDDLITIAIRPEAGTVPEVVDRIRAIPWARPGAPVASPGARVAVATLPKIPSPLRVDLRRLIVSPGPELTMTLRSGLEIRAGGPAGLAERLSEVPRVLAALRAQGVVPAALDLRYTGSIAVTPATEGEGR
jgi:cell division protein FtsQ